MPEQIEQYMRTLKLGGMAREWRNVEFQSTEQYVRPLPFPSSGLSQQLLPLLGQLLEEPGMFHRSRLFQQRPHILRPVVQLLVSAIAPAIPAHWMVVVVIWS